jgi:hypothetical protein
MQTPQPLEAGQHRAGFLGVLRKAGLHRLRFKPQFERQLLHAGPAVDVTQFVECGASYTDSGVNTRAIIRASRVTPQPVLRESTHAGTTALLVNSNTNSVAGLAASTPLRRELSTSEGVLQQQRQLLLRVEVSPGTNEVTARVVMPVRPHSNASRELMLPEELIGEKKNAAELLEHIQHPARSWCVVKPSGQLVGIINMHITKLAKGLVIRGPQTAEMEDRALKDLIGGMNAQFALAELIRDASEDSDVEKVFAELPKEARLGLVPALVDWYHRVNGSNLKSYFIKQYILRI